MEFLETFGCNWSPKEVFKVIIGRAPYRSDQSGAIPSSHSDLPIRATLPERQGRVARVCDHPETRERVRSDLSQRHSEVAPEARSDYSERRAEIARVLITRKRENESGATSRSDTARSLPKHGATTRSDERRSLRVLFLLELMISQGPFGHFMMHVFIF
ncbi:hypothetical protein F2Q68_00041063 [Brassica cretica]|uniref:Uncharacterized protein n=1 Tax=Brassica cretica TaxID=69181 RepID=A0A8S9MIJ9_BRACR|nr:hypothetical protein F2Q68_00041063 [Brassica cretica]